MRAHLQPAPTALPDETRHKLLHAAGEVFGEVGYQAATVREIAARAGVNLAAINYHFGDKLTLYTEALELAVCTPTRLADEALMEAPPEEALRMFVNGMFRKMTEVDRPAWYTRVMAFEMVRPTPALNTVIEHVIRPNSQLLARIVGRILELPPEDKRTRLATHSVIAQVIHYVQARPVLEQLWPQLKMTPEEVEAIADHVVRFSLAALKGYRGETHG